MRFLPSGVLGDLSIGHHAACSGSYQALRAPYTCLLWIAHMHRIYRENRSLRKQTRLYHRGRTVKG
jgi:hypothetical protein